MNEQATIESDIDMSLVEFIVNSNAIEGYQVDPQSVISALEGIRAGYPLSYVSSNPHITGHLAGLGAVKDINPNTLDAAISVHSAMGPDVLEAGAPGMIRSGVEAKASGGIQYAPSSDIPTAMAWWESQKFSSPFDRHAMYELIHPFSDGNGRSGRILLVADMGFDFGSVNKMISDRSKYINALNNVRENYTGNFWSNSLLETIESVRRTRHLLDEVRGRALEGYTTKISRIIVNILKAPTVKKEVDTMSERDEISLKSPHGLDLITNDLDDVRDIYLVLSVNDEKYVDVQGNYAFNPTDRSQSDLYISVDIPRHYDFSIFSLLIPELKEAIRHELEHSTDTTETLSIPPEDKWESLSNIESHFTSEAETKGYVTGFLKKAKSSRRPVTEIIDEYLLNIYNTALSHGYDQEDVNSVINHVRDIWRHYLFIRYPEAETEEHHYEQD